MLSVFSALCLLRPYDVDKPKTRIGPKHDGGYVFLDDLSPDQPVMSYGIGNEYTFDRVMAERGHTVYMFDHTLQKFEQIVVEVHSVERLGREDYRARFIALFEKLNAQFTLFHIHANNFDGPDTFYFVEGMPVASIIELSYVRSDRVKRMPSSTVYPTILDYPNLAHRDKLMWFFPFIPNDAGLDAFAASLEQVRATAPR